jgi:hypothetical protein
MSVIKSREIPVIITAIFALFVVFEYFFKVPEATRWSMVFQKWAVILASFAIGIGFVNTSLFHLRNIRRKAKGQWFYSLWTIFLMSLIIILGVGLGPAHQVYGWIYNATAVPLGSATTALLGFFTFSAAYRAFRARNIEAALLLITGMIIILYVVPLGELVWPGWPIIGEWLTGYPNAVVGRVLYATVVMGTISLGVRIILGYERGYLAGE